MVFLLKKFLTMLRLYTIIQEKDSDRYEHYIGGISMSANSKTKSTAKKPTQTVWIEETEEVCLNCQYFRQYYRAEGLFRSDVPLNRGWCQFHRRDESATRPPCTYKRMKCGDSQQAEAFAIAYAAALNRKAGRK